MEVFDGMTEMVRSKISNRSLKLFTLSGIYHATKILLSQKQGAPFAEKLASATAVLDRGGEQYPRLGPRQEARSQPGGAARDVRPLPCDRPLGTGPGGAIPSRDRSIEMAQAIGTAPETRLVKVEHAALGGKSHDRRPAVQVEHEYLADGKRHQAAVEVAAHGEEQEAEERLKAQGAS